MNESIFLYDNIGSDEFISKLLEYSDTECFHDGQVGNHVDVMQKKRRDLFIKKPHMLRYIDNTIFDAIYDSIKTNFGDIKYREHWKIGKYYGNQEGFYSAHRDTTGATNYRTMSMIYSLTDPSEYEGGTLVFDELGKEFKLKKGQLILFDSSLLHKVTKVTSGIRTVLVGFMFDDKGCQIKKAIAQRRDFTNYISNYIPLLDHIKLNYDNILDDNSRISDVSLNTIKKTVFGDIDTSDKHKDHPWNVTDDYYMEDNDSDTLLITFAGMGWKDSIPTFIFYNFLKSYTNIDKLFLRDINCRYYISGIKNSTTCFKETIDMYRELISRKKYKKIVALGCSAGGYAAILYGQLLGLDKVIAFSPQTVLTRRKEDLIGDIYNAPKTCKWLRTLHLDDEEYQKALDLNNYRHFTCPVDIHYSVNGNKGADKKHAIYLESSNCTIIEHPGNDHMIALTLRDKGKLKEIIDKAIGIGEDVVDISL
jgi:predicted esterase YcpF (UPF0227 family)